MFQLQFWIFLAVSVSLALLSVRIKKITFIDLQIIIMIIAVTMSLDMLFCKQFNLYNYVNTDYKGWYSFWANFIIAPSLGIIFVKFIPESPGKIALYIIIWSVLLTALELFILKPATIVIYHGWRPFPYSLIGYILCFILEDIYFESLKKQLK